MVEYFRVDQLQIGAVVAIIDMCYMELVILIDGSIEINDSS